MKDVLRNKKKWNLREKFSHAAIYAIFQVKCHTPGAVKPLLHFKIELCYVSCL